MQISIFAKVNFLFNALRNFRSFYKKLILKKKAICETNRAKKSLINLIMANPENEINIYYSIGNSNTQRQESENR